MLSTFLESSTPEEAEALRAGAERRLEKYVAADGSLEVPGLARALFAIRD